MNFLSAAIALGHPRAIFLWVIAVAAQAVGAGRLTADRVRPIAVGILVHPTGSFRKILLKKSAGQAADLMIAALLN